ncbi:hypothetical protein [Phytohabitans aurantiacus]|uniref:Luciferase-like domain-containing protein n=1 Tax=Phytohabitans aurantiacus TaxID=3016789 RepID=A0ABQ5R7H8_9ACTN|nr:hypothetical protein [Phytohabitans aurantiacus]GLI02122.1 hypothetical protein Pa4123_74000 [Phytohabitans aurantiacus]
MRLGRHYWNFSTPDDPASIAPTLAETARIAEEAGWTCYATVKAATTTPSRRP